MPRPDKDRAKELTPEKLQHAVKKITQLGITIDEQTATHIKFKHKGESVIFYPYTGWFSGKTVTDGRGIRPLLNQLKTNQ